MVNLVRSIRAPISCRSWIAGGSGCPTGTATSGPLEAPYVKGKWWDPYNQSVLKGDYPIFGQNIFMNLSAISDTLFEVRRLPTASGVSAKDPGSADVFGGGDQKFLNQNFIVSLELFKGDTAFKPRDLELRATGVFNVNFLNVQENGVVNVDVREGVSRTDTFASLQELFLEYHLGDLTPNYDFVSSRFGIQNFVSDFRGFIFSDSALGARFFGNLGSNRQQFNAAYFRTFEKDTNSGLNRLFEMRDQNIGDRQLLLPGLPGAGLHACRPASTTCTTAATRTRTRTGSSCGRPWSAPRRRTPSTRSISASRATATLARST